ncbi:M6 family metalloprotease domain-containing protein [Streptomyces sp. NPDC008313]|uniref:M6 family metalloprotease domain-containing protein n=1 Tax=Streptomyces sp. NPDC008313 TaxID=3364826 RepID=UPI0036F056D5
MPRPLSPKGLTRGTLRSLTSGALRSLSLDGAPRLRSTAAVFTSMTALAATSLVTGPALAEPLPSPCALKRTSAHHSEGLDTWNASYPRPTRPLDAVMVFLSFPDAEPMTTPAELAADHFPATSTFFSRASYGRFTLRPHPLREWIRMPHSSTSYAIRRDWSSSHRAAYLRDALTAADRRVDFSRYDVVYFVADPDAPGVDSDATKVVNLDTPLHADGKSIRRVVTVFEKHPPDRLVLAHETGHAFDLPDLYHRPSDGKGDWDTFVGDWDLMGSQFGLAPDLFGWHKWKLGWLDPRQVVCVQRPGSTRLTLEPLGAGPAEGEGVVQASDGVAGEGAGAATPSEPVAEPVAGPGARASGNYGGPVSDAEVPASGPGAPGTEGSEPAGAGPGGPVPGSAVSVRASEGPDSGGAAGAGPDAPMAEGAAATGPDPAGEPGAGRFGGAAQGAPSAGARAQTFGTGRGTKLAVIRTGIGSALALEARDAVGNDSSTCTRGILVYRVRSGAASGGGPVEVIDAHPRTEACWQDSVYPPLADAPVALGETFTVPGEDVRITVEDRTASGAWTVTVSLD